MYLNTVTGELLTDYDGPETDEIVWDEGHSLTLPETQTENDEWLPDWYLRGEVTDDAELAALKAQYDRRVKVIRARKKHREHAWSARLEERVRYDLDSQKGKKKSVAYFYGKAGWRKGKAKTEVTDAKALKDWAMVHAPLALKHEITVSKGLLTDEQAKKAPGVEIVPAGDRFYWKGAP